MADYGSLFASQDPNGSVPINYGQLLGQLAGMLPLPENGATRALAKTQQGLQVARMFNLAPNLIGTSQAPIGMAQMFGLGAAPAIAPLTGAAAMAAPTAAATGLGAMETGAALAPIAAGAGAATAGAAAGGGGLLASLGLAAL